MTKYSRVAKYEDLRNRMQNEADTTISSRDLSRYEKKLNEINANNFNAPKEYSAADYDPIHARHKEMLDASSQSNLFQTPTVNTSTMNFNTGSFNTNTLNNDYLDDYIREVKQYNKDQGTAYSTNTNLNILHSIQEEANTTPKIPNKPYPEETTQFDFNQFLANNNYQKPSNAATHTINATSPEIPQFNSNRRTFDEFMNEDDYNSSTMTKEDIAAEVQNLIRGQINQPKIPSVPLESKSRKEERTYDYDFEADRTVRQQLLNETTQMRAQLDNYEDNLTEVSTKMQHTDKMLSNVLIVLIIVLVVILLVVVYWILNANGIL